MNNYHQIYILTFYKNNGIFLLKILCKNNEPLPQRLILFTLFIGWMIEKWQLYAMSVVCGRAALHINI